MCDPRPRDDPAAGVWANRSTPSPRHRKAQKTQEARWLIVSSQHFIEAQLVGFEFILSTVMKERQQRQGSAQLFDHFVNQFAVLWNNRMNFRRANTQPEKCVIEDSLSSSNSTIGFIE